MSVLRSLTIFPCFASWFDGLTALIPENQDSKNLRRTDFCHFSMNPRNSRSLEGDFLMHPDAKTRTPCSLLHMLLHVYCTCRRVQVYANIKLNWFEGENGDLICRSMMIRYEMCGNVVRHICSYNIYIYSQVYCIIFIFSLVGVWGCMVAHRIKTCQVEASLSLTEQNDRWAFSPKLHIAVVMVGDKGFLVQKKRWQSRDILLPNIPKTKMETKYCGWYTGILHFWFDCHLRVSFLHLRCSRVRSYRLKGWKVGTWHMSRIGTYISNWMQLQFVHQDLRRLKYYSPAGRILEISSIIIFVVRECSFTRFVYLQKENHVW